MHSLSLALFADCECECVCVSACLLCVHFTCIEMYDLKYNPVETYSQSYMCSSTCARLCTCNVIEFMYDVSIYNRSLFVHSRLVKLHSLPKHFLDTTNIRRWKKKGEKRKGRRKQNEDEDKNHRPVNLYSIYTSYINVIPLLHSKPINANVIVKFLRLLSLAVVIVCFWNCWHIHLRRVWARVVVVVVCVCSYCISMHAIRFSSLLLWKYSTWIQHKIV